MQAAGRSAREVEIAFWRDVSGEDALGQEREIGAARERGERAVDVGERGVGVAVAVRCLDSGDAERRHAETIDEALDARNGRRAPRATKGMESGYRLRWFARIERPVARRRPYAHAPSQALKTPFEDLGKPRGGRAIRN